ncbi:MAG: response regulator [Candidatus Margulisbacteria bacterium]|nr:response regulator [Candidatus Margulisiibacteriota bacterium]
MKIMIVDDELVSRSKLTMILRQFGICHEYDRGDRAVIAFERALIEKQPYNLMTLDISMPDMGGMLVLSKIRAIEDRMRVAPENKVVIIMVTSNDEKESFFTAISQHCNDYIIKPVEKEVMLQRLKKLDLIK